MAKEIGIIVGSLREGSLNRLVAKTFESILPKNSLFYVKTKDLVHSF